jgi:dihydroflavonol-4-reductase
MSDGRCLVTGATGFVGAAVARALLAQGRRVRVLAREGGDRRNLDGLDVEVATGDLLDPASFPGALAGCDALYHVAADYRMWTPDPARMYAINVEGTRALMQAALAAGVPRIVYTSSVATLGLRDDGKPANEGTPVALEQMVGPYKRSKFMAEQAVRAMVKEQGLPAVIVNPSTPIGPRDVKPTPTGRMVVEAASGRMPAYLDTGLNFAHVDDVALGHLLAFERGKIGERYILGGDNMDLKSMLGLIAELSGRRAPWFRVPRRPLFPIAFVAEQIARFTHKEPFVTVDGLRLAAKKMYFTSAKAERELGYHARPAKDGFVDALVWFRAQGYVS